jgi:Protein of unknown function (DUF3363)
MKMEASPRQRIERRASAPVERQKSTCLSRCSGGDLGPLDYDDVDPAATEEKSGTRADDAGAANHNAHQYPPLCPRRAPSRCTCPVIRFRKVIYITSSAPARITVTEPHHSHRVDGRQLESCSVLRRAIWPFNHIIVRGVLDDGGILNIAGDYIAHGIRHRAGELVTRELGHQSEIELQTKLQNEVEAERPTRLDKMLLSEQQEQGVIDLRPGEGATFLVRENRNLMIGRVRHLERYGIATELEPGRWTLSDRAQQVLKELDHRNEVINSIHRALTKNGLADERGISQFALHGEGSGEKIVGRVLTKGLAGDEMGERVYLVVDGIDGRVHHMEFKDPGRIEAVGRDMIVEAAPVVSGPRPADRNIASNAEEDNGIYRPSRHLERVRDSFERQGKDPESFVRSHIRRLEALRRAGHVERIDADNWKIPRDIVERGQAYDLN